MRHDVQYRVDADLTPAERHVRGFIATSRQGAVGLASALNPASAAAGKLTTGLGPAGIAGAAVLATTALIGTAAAMREIVSEASNIGKVADRIGITTDFLQEFRHAAKLSGIDVGQADKALEQFNKRIGEAVTRGGPLKDIFEANNVAIKDSNGNIKTISELLFETARLLSNTESAQVKATIANEAFGRSGAGMINMMQQGTVEFRNSIEAAKDLGVALDEDAIRKAEDLDDAWENMTTRLSRNMKTAVLSVTDAIGQLGGEISNLVRDTESLFRNPSFRNLLKVGGNSIGLLGLPEGLGDNLADRFTSPTSGERVQNAFEQSSAKQGGTKQLQRALLAKIARDSGTETVLPQSAAALSQSEKEAAKALKEEQRELNAERKKAIALRSQQQAKITAVVEKLMFEAEQFGLNSEQQRINNELRAAGVDINSEAGQKIAELVSLLKQQQAAEVASAEATKLLAERQKQKGETATFFVNQSISALDALTDKTLTAEEAVRKLILSFVEAAAKGALLGEGPLAGLFGGGLGKLPASNAPQGVGALVAAGVGGLFAKGGVSNRPAIFGEAGPEAAVPLPDGRRIPVDLRGSQQDGGFVSIHVAPSKYFDTRVGEIAGPVAAKIVESAAPDIVDQSKTESVRSMSNGSFDNALNQRFGMKQRTMAR